MLHIYMLIYVYMVDVDIHQKNVHETLKME